MKTNPRLTQDKADWLAAHWSVGKPHADGGDRWEILGDPAHKIINAHIFRVDEMLALYAAITAPLLAVEASDDSLGQWWKGRYTLAEYHERLKRSPTPTSPVSRTQAICCITTSPRESPRCSRISSPIELAHASSLVFVGREKMHGFPEHCQDTPWMQSKSTKSAQPLRT